MSHQEKPRGNPTVLELEMAAIMAASDREESKDQWNYYFNENLRIQIKVRNTKPHGVFKLFYANGDLAMQGEFWNGERRGETTYYWLDGSVWLEKKEGK